MEPERYDGDPAVRRSDVFVPKWVTKVASVVLSGTTALLVVAYGYHLGRAWHYGIPAEYVVISAEGIVPLFFPGLLATLLIAVLAVPLVPVLRNVYLLSIGMLRRHSAVSAVALALACALLPFVGFLCAVFTILDVAHNLMTPMPTGSPLDVAPYLPIWIAGVCFMILSRRGKGKEGDCSTVRSMLLYMSFRLSTIVFWIAAFVVTYWVQGYVPLLLALLSPLALIAIALKSSEITDRYRFRVVSYPIPPRAEGFDRSVEEAWLRSTRWCAFFAMVVVALVFVGSACAGVVSAMSESSYLIKLEDEGTKLAMGHGKADDVALCILDVYDARTAVAVEAVPAASGGYSAILSDATFFLVDPSEGARRVTCEMGGLPEVDPILHVFRLMGER